MTQPARFLFDECLSRPAVERQICDLLHLYGVDAEIAHLLSKFPPATPDKEWIPEIAKQGGWIIVTSDRGTHSRKDERLPMICRDFGVTHVLLSGSLHRRNTYFAEPVPVFVERPHNAAFVFGTDLLDASNPQNRA